MKAEELVLYRGATQGGLGLLNIEARAKYNIISSFVEMSCSKKFIKNGYLSALYNYYIEDIGVRKPIRPPYYSEGMFHFIKNAKLEGFDPAELSIRDWYYRFSFKSSVPRLSRKMAR